MTIAATVELDKYERDFFLKFRNGATAKVSGPWTTVGLIDFVRSHHFDTLAGELRVGIAQVVDSDASALLLYSDETDADNPVQLFGEVELICRFYLDTGGYEDVTLFRGFVGEPDPKDAEMAVVAYDKAWKLTFQFAELDVEAERVEVNSGGEVTLRASTTPGETDPQVLEVDPTSHPEAWWGSIRRSWVDEGVRVLKDGTPMPADQVLLEPDWGRLTLKVAYAGGSTYKLDHLNVYKEGTLEAERVIEEALRYPKANVGPGFGDSDLQNSLTGTFTFTNGSTAVTVSGGDIGNELEKYDRIRLASDPYDEFGVVLTVTPPSNITLLYPYLGSSSAGAAVKSTLRASTLSLSALKWTKMNGTLQELLRYMKANELLPPNYQLWHDPFSDRMVGQLVYMGKIGVEPDSPSADFEVTAKRVNDVGTPRPSDEVATAIVVAAEVRQEKSLLDGMEDKTGGSGAGLYRLLPNLDTGEGDLQWKCTNSSECSLENLNDGNLTNKWRWYHDWPDTDPNEGLDYVNAFYIDFGPTSSDWVTIERCEFQGATKDNPDSGDHRQYLAIEGSHDNSTYYSLGPSALDIPVSPGSPGSATGFSNPAAFRYIRVRMRPAKDTRNCKLRCVSLAEFKIFGSSKYSTEAKITSGAATYPDIQAATLYDKTYYTVGYVGKLISNLRVVSEPRAIIFANMELNERIRLYQQVHLEGIPFRPDVMLYQIAEVCDKFNIHDPDNKVKILVESLTLTAETYSLDGTNYLAEVLGD